MTVITVEDQKRQQNKQRKGEENHINTKPNTPKEKKKKETKKKLIEKEAPKNHRYNKKTRTHTAHTDSSKQQIIITVCLPFAVNP